MAFTGLERSLLLPHLISESEDLWHNVSGSLALVLSGKSMIRKAHNEDIPFLVKIHMAALPGDLLPRLGRDFLVKTFYPAVLRSDQAFTIVHEEDGAPDAFVIFAYHSDALTNQVIKDKVSLAGSMLRGLLADPTLAREAFGFLRGFRTELEEDLRIKLEEIPELYLIATSPDRQSRGLGCQIVRHGLRLLADEGYPCSLVKTSSDRAREFYLKQGYRLIGFEYRQKRRLYLLLHEYPVNE